MDGKNMPDLRAHIAIFLVGFLTALAATLAVRAKKNPLIKGGKKCE